MSRPETLRVGGARLLVVLLVATVLLPLLPGATVSAATDTNFRFEGRGWGHGIGMSQYGARGQALEGVGYQGILAHYYQDTVVRERPVDGNIVVGLDQRVREQTLVARGGTMEVSFAGQTWTAPENDWWTLVALAEQGRCRLLGPATDDDTSQGTETPTDGSTEGTTQQPQHPEGPCRLSARRGTADHLELNNRDSSTANDPGYSRGRFEIHPAQWQQSGQATHGFHVTLPLPSMRVYMYGLAEVPYGWELHALRAQVVAARSYATFALLGAGGLRSDCACHLFDDVRSQVYKGLREEEPLHDRWAKAVDDTENEVVVYPPGGAGTQNGVVQAFYSSSSGGRTENIHEVWNTSPKPYLVSVDDHWAKNPNLNPYASWTIEKSPQGVANAFSELDEVHGLRVTARNTSGSAATVEITGTQDGQPVTVTRTGQQIRSALGLRSAYIDRIFLPPFVDDDGSVFEADIAWVADQGITEGCNDAGDRFCPTRDVTRGQMAAFLARALNLTATSDVEFDDVPDDHPFAEEINKIATEEITEGCGDGSDFCPNRKVRRQEMAKFLAVGLGLTETSGASFSDVPADSPFAEAIDKVATAEITKGCGDGTRFCPLGPVPRGQMAAFLARALRDGA